MAATAGPDNHASETQPTNGAMAFAFLAALQPPIAEGQLASLRKTLIEGDISLSMLRAMGVEAIKDALLVDVITAARIISAIGDEPLKCLAPPPLGHDGEPVVVRPKIGFTNLNNIDTVGQTVFARFFLDLYWHDPRLVGATYVPENTWRPADCYLINQVEYMSVIAHADQPILIDSKRGLLLWPLEFCGQLVNPMDLHTFPFDRDSIELHVHQDPEYTRDLLHPTRPTAA